MRLPSRVLANSNDMRFLWSMIPLDYPRTREGISGLTDAVNAISEKKMGDVGRRIEKWCGD